MDELADIRAFVHVAETGSFSAAARLLGVSKSVITKRINELEHQLKAQLLMRSTRRLSVTDTGAQYLERCVRIIADVDDARSAITSLSTGLTGLLRVSCIASFAARQLCADLREFQQKHPGIMLEFHHNDRVYDPVREGYDLCIQPGDITGDAIIKRPIVAVRRLLVATPAYLQRHGAISDPMELTGHRIAHNNFIQPGSALSLIAPSGVFAVPIRPIVLTNSIFMLHEAVLRGDCVGILPTYFIVDELRSGLLLSVLPDFSVPQVVLSAFYRRSPLLPLKVRMFLNFLIERYKDLPPWERALRVPPSAS